MLLPELEEYSRKIRVGESGQNAQLGLVFRLNGKLLVLLKHFIVPTNPRSDEHTEQQIVTCIIDLLDHHKNKGDTVKIHEIQIISHLSPCRDCAKKLAKLPEILCKYPAYDSSQINYSIGSHGIYQRPATPSPEIDSELATSVATMKNAKWRIESVNEIPSLMLKPADMKSVDYFMLMTKDNPALRKKIASQNVDFRKAVAEFELKQFTAAGSAANQPAAAASSLINLSPAVSSPK
jgi:hypothetical protein